MIAILVFQLLDLFFCGFPALIVAYGTGPYPSVPFIYKHFVAAIETDHFEPPSNTAEHNVNVLKIYAVLGIFLLTIYSGGGIIKLIKENEN